MRKAKGGDTDRRGRGSVTIEAEIGVKQPQSGMFTEI
jgi:hypothetical protein